MSSAVAAPRQGFGATARSTKIAVGLLAPVSLVLAVALLVVDHVGRDRHIQEALLLTWSSAAFLVAAVSAVGIGAFVSVRRPEHPVGWLIWGFGLSILLAGVAESYADVALLGPPPAQPGGNAAAVYANADFVPWFILLTLIITLTPSGKLAARWGRPFVIICGSAGVVFFVGRLLRTGPLEFPLQKTDNPIGLGSELADPGGALTRLAATVTLLCLVSSVVVLLSRFRRASGDDRAQLKWVAVSAIGVAIMAVAPPFASWQLSPSSASAVVSVTLGIACTFLLLGIGASVMRYRLYDVDRVLSRGAAYFLITVIVSAVFVVVALVLSQITNSRDSSSIRVGVSTLAAAVAAGLVRGRVQEAVDRRFRRRHFEATAVMRAFLTAVPTGRDDAEQALRNATGDASIRVGYPRAESNDEFIAADGSPFLIGVEPQRANFLLVRGGERVAFIERDVEAGPADLVRQCAQMALAQLDNIRLRAELRTRLVEAEHSRARLAVAASAERHRIERNLHDGAQQRLVAVMVALRTASLRAARGVPVDDDLQIAIDDLRIAVQELRELANGLVPALLVRDGLEAALYDLAGRCPIPVTVDAQLPRLPDAVEETAYYVAAEGLANAMKHAAASQIAITASINEAGLALNVSDDGIGGSNPRGPGLLGLADRVHVLFGDLHVLSPSAGGTLLRLELPCA